MTRRVSSCWSSGLALALGLMASFPAYGQNANLAVSSNATGDVLLYDSNGNLLNGTYISGLNSPRGVLGDSVGDLYVAADLGGQVFEYSPTGTLLNTITAGLTHPVDMAFDSSGNLWVTNQNGSSSTVNEYNSLGALINTVTAVGGPTGIAIGLDGNIYVTEMNTPTTACSTLPTSPG